MLHVALYEPEIPPNTGNIMRLCANAGAKLHLIHPLGFTLDDKRMRRAGLDYQEWVTVTHHASFEAFMQAHGARRMFACSTKTQTLHSDVRYNDEDLFLFGPETRGLPQHVREANPCIRIPMQPTSRSLNLSNAVAIILFEAWRQLDYA